MLDDLMAESAAASVRPKVSPREFWEACKAARQVFLKVVAATAVVMFLVTLITLHLVGGGAYTAEMTVMPNAAINNNSGSISSLSSLAGLSGPNDTTFDTYMAVRNSKLLAERLMKVPGLPQRIFLGQWDASTHQWRPPKGLLPSTKRAISAMLGFKSWLPPDAGDMAQYLSKMVTFESDRRTEITHLKYTNANPQLASFLLQQVHDQAEDILRVQAKNQSDAVINHLLAELRVVTVGEQRSALIELLSEQEKKAMMIDRALPYAAVVIDPPFVDVANPPRPLLTLFLVVAGSMFLAAMAVAVWVLLRLRRAKARSAAT